MTIPTEALYGQQWHFRTLTNNTNTSFMELLWNEFDGTGVSVGVYDTGVEYAHSDLNGNYDASKHVVINGVVHDGVVVGDNGHGTCVAGIIAAVLNGEGTVGVAHGSSLTSINIFAAGSTASADAAFDDPVNATGFYQALHQMTKFDIANHSWGVSPDFRTAYNINTVNGYVAKIHDEYAFVTANGRGGLGTIVVQAAGNDNLDGNGDGMNASRYSLSVGAVLENGFAASYSNFGAFLLVSSAGGDFYIKASEGNYDTTDGTRLIVTTDQAGGNGFNDLAPDVNGADPPDYSFNPTDFTDGMAGTSAATPMVSGIVALMLQANPNLGWRDVNEILARTAFQTGSGVGKSAGLNENNTWFVNGADDWNGGGMHFSEDYGYGNADAFGAVRVAEALGIIGAAARTSANELKRSTAVLETSIAPADNDTNFKTFSFEFASGMLIEQVDLSLDIQHQDIGDLNIFLTSPEGTVVQVHRVNPSATGAFQTWTFGIEALRGERAAGTWTLSVNDALPGDTGTIDSLKLSVFGRAAAAADTYHFTDEFRTFANMAAVRKTLVDTDGGIDWINAAAVTSGTTLNLNDGVNSTLDGIALRIARGTLIEHAVLGDGNDTLTGNELRNRLHGMRGNDTITGGQGVDTMAGGQGNDVYFADNSGDRVIEAAGQGFETVHSSATYILGANIENLKLTGGGTINGTGNALANLITGNAANNVINGGAGADTMVGRGGNDTYFVNAAGDKITEAVGEGIDTVRAGFSRALEFGVDNLVLTGNAAIGGTGNGLANRLTGNAAANILDGKAGADTLTGGGGNDVYIVDNAGDSVVEAANAGTDTVRSAVTRALEFGVENLTLSGTAGIAGTGNGLANVIVGNAGANDLNGLAGSDTLKGGAGSDRFFFTTALGAGNVDVIQAFSVTADTMMLDDAVFTDLAAVDADAFFKGARAADTEDRIIYNSATGALLFDKDGAGGVAAVGFARTAAGLALTFADFLVV